MSLSFIDFVEAVEEMEQAVTEGTLFFESKQVTGLTHDMVRKVYHRDYMTTRDKPYRKYNAQKRARRKGLKK